MTCKNIERRQINVCSLGSPFHSFSQSSPSCFRISNECESTKKLKFQNVVQEHAVRHGLYSQKAQSSDQGQTSSSPCCSFSPELGTFWNATRSASRAQDVTPAIPRLPDFGFVDRLIVSGSSDASFVDNWSASCAS